MNIIALRGRGECGKSETIGIHLRGFLTVKTYPREDWRKHKDKRECVSYDGKTIALCPPGDSEEIVKDNIVFIEKHPCDVVFTATRSRGRGCRALEDFAKEMGAELIWIWKEYNDDFNRQGQTAENMKFAEKLMRFLDKTD